MGRPRTSREQLAVKARWLLSQGLTMTTSQAAILLSVDSKTIGRWMRSGQMAGWRTDGGHWRIPSSEVVKRLTRDQGDD